MGFRVYYVDDSGASETGWAVYSWVEVNTDHWHEATAAWLGFRAYLYKELAIPADFELHSARFLQGRGHPSRDETWNCAKSERISVFAQALTAIRNLPGVEVGAVYRHTDHRQDRYGHVMTEVYRALYSRLDARLGLGGDRGMIIVDGNGTDPSYQLVHYELRPTHPHLVVEACFEMAHTSQWIQIADIVAYTAYQAVARLPKREFAWHWYDEALEGTERREV